jgi:hypothetical protein
MVVGIGMIAGAMAMGAVWEKHQTVTVTKVFEVTDTIADVSLNQGASALYTISVKNLGTTPVSVTLTCTMADTGTGVTATISGDATRTIAAGATSIYSVTIAVSSNAEGTVGFTYLLTQTA